MEMTLPKLTPHQEFLASDKELLSVTAARGRRSGLGLCDKDPAEDRVLGIHPRRVVEIGLNRQRVLMAEFHL